ncbi:hypothetical protein ANN_02090, partial [Periplaneta americana]
MAGFCEGGNEPPGSLKASSYKNDDSAAAARREYRRHFNNERSGPVPSEHVRYANRVNTFFVRELAGFPTRRPYWFQQDGRFGRPQLDTCCECEELQVRVESPTLNETAKKVAEGQLIVHKRKRNKFYASLKQMKEYCKDKGNALCLTEGEKSWQYQHTTTSSGQRRNGYIEALPYIGGIQTKHFLFAFGAEIALLNQKAYTDCQSITEDKVRDLKSLLPDFPKYIHIFMAKKAKRQVQTTQK